MTERIGKYRIKETDSSLQVHYIYSFSDLIGSVFYLLGIAMGLLVLFAKIKNFEIENLYSFGFWFVTVVGGFLLCYFMYLIILGLYKPLNGVLQVDALKKEIIISDFLKKEIIKFSEIGTMYCEMVDEQNHDQARQLYGMFTIKKNGGETLECFIIRSSISVDIGRKVNKDIMDTAKQIKTRIFSFISSKD